MLKSGREVEAGDGAGDNGRPDSRPHSFRQRATRFGACLAPVLAVALLGTPASAPARPIVDKLHRFFLSSGFPPNRRTPFGPNVTTPNLVEVVTPVVERVALRGIDFPVTASSPGFTYRFNFELGVPERSTESFGPVFVERPETVGHRRLDLGVAYLWANLTEFGGASFGRQLVMRGGKVVQPGITVQQEFLGTDFSLLNHELSLSATYGLTDEWDVNVLQPLIWNSLALHGIRRAGLSPCPPNPCPVTGPSRPVVFKASAFGPGDTLLRTKYRLSELRLASVAATFTLRLPVGDAKELHGLGDTTVTPGLTASHTLGAHELHSSVGFEFNARDGERDRARYALGTSLRPFDRLAFLVDIIGSSSVTADKFEIRRSANGPFFPQFAFGTNQFVQSRSSTKIIAFVPRSDVVDLVVGAKANPRGSIVAFTSVILPLTNDGLRADVIPSIGLEASF